MRHDIVLDAKDTGNFVEAEPDVRPFSGAAIVDTLESVRDAQSKVDQMKELAAEIDHSLAVEAARQPAWTILPPAAAAVASIIAGLLAALPFANMLPPWPRPFSSYAVTAEIAAVVAFAVIAFKHLRDVSDDRLGRGLWLLLGVAAAGCIAALGAEAAEVDGRAGIMKFAAIGIAALIPGLLARITTRLTRRLELRLNAASAQLAEAEAEAAACVAAAWAAFEAELNVIMMVRHVADRQSRQHVPWRNPADGPPARLIRDEHGTAARATDVELSLTRTSLQPIAQHQRQRICHER